MNRRLVYGLLALIVFGVEISIAASVRDAFIRPYVGDSLAVVLVYLTLRTLTRLDTRMASISAFAFACCIEISQYFHLLNLLHLEHVLLARLILGGAFDWMDFVAYASGAIFILVAEFIFPARET